MSHRPIPHTFIRFMLWAYQPHTMGVWGYVCLAILSGLYGVCHAYVLQQLIDALVMMQIEHHWDHRVLLYALLLLINHQVYSLCWRGMAYIDMNITPQIQNHIIARFFHQMVRQPHDHHHTSGAVAHQIDHLAQNVGAIFYVPLGAIIKGITQVCSTLLGLWMVNGFFTGALMVWLLGFIGLSLRWSATIGQRSEAYVRSRAATSGQLFDVLLNLDAVRFYVRHSHENQRLQTFLQETKDKFQAKERMMLVYTFIQSLGITAYVAWLLWYLIQLIQHHTITVGEFTFVLTAVWYVTESIWFTMEQFNRVSDLVGQCQQSLQILLGPRISQHHESKTPLYVTEGSIVFNHIGFQYRGRKPLFRQLDLIIEPKEKVGVVGYTGSGKSTLIRLLLNALVPQQGYIMIDGQCLSEASPDSLRTQLGLIPQDPILFHRSIWDNIHYGDLQADIESVMAASQQAHLHAHVMSLPEGYDTLVGDRGIKLSGGQRQQVAIARMLLKNPSILLMDEATSQLDAVTEQAVLNSLQTLMADRTTLAVAHRLSTLLRMDRILVFDRGSLVESGTHDALLHQRGLYQKLWDQQSQGFLPTEPTT